MKHYRIKVRDDKAEFFEELLRYLDFLDYEQVEGFSEPRVYTNFELKARKEDDTKKPGRRKKESQPSKKKSKHESSGESLKEVLARIDQMRDQSRQNR
jgi:hypothetical protein